MKTDEHESSNYWYFHDDGVWTPEKGRTLGSAYVLVLRAIFRQIMSIETRHDRSLVRHWNDDLVKPETSWYLEEPGTLPIGIVLSSAIMKELCARVDSVAENGSVRYHYMAHVAAANISDDVELDISGRLAYASLEGLVLVGWVHVSFVNRWFSPVTHVDVLDDLTTHNHRRRPQPTFGPLQDP